jgi:hypothetical protein
MCTKDFLTQGTQWSQRIKQIKTYELKKMLNHKDTKNRKEKMELIESRPPPICVKKRADIPSPDEQTRKKP